MVERAESQITSDQTALYTCTHTHSDWYVTGPTQSNFGGSKQIELVNHTLRFTATPAETIAMHVHIVYYGDTEPNIDQQNHRQ